MAEFSQQILHDKVFKIIEHHEYRTKYNEDQINKCKTDLEHRIQEQSFSNRKNTQSLQEDPSSSQQNMTDEQSIEHHCKSNEMKSSNDIIKENCHDKKNTPSNQRASEEEDGEVNIHIQRTLANPRTLLSALQINRKDIHSNELVPKEEDQCQDSQEQWNSRNPFISKINSYQQNRLASLEKQQRLHQQTMSGIRQVDRIDTSPQPRDLSNEEKLKKLRDFKSNISGQRRISITPSKSQQNDIANKYTNDDKSSLSLNKVIDVTGQDHHGSNDNLQDSRQIRIPRGSPKQVLVPILIGNEENVEENNDWMQNSLIQEESKAEECAIPSVVYGRSSSCSSNREHNMEKSTNMISIQKSGKLSQEEEQEGVRSVAHSCTSSNFFMKGKPSETNIKSQFASSIEGHSKNLFEEKSLQEKQQQSIHTQMRQRDLNGISKEGRSKERIFSQQSSVRPSTMNRSITSLFGHNINGNNIDPSCFNSQEWQFQELHHSVSLVSKNNVNVSQNLNSIPESSRINQIHQSVSSQRSDRHTINKDLTDTQSGRQGRSSIVGSNQINRPTISPIPRRRIFDQPQDSIRQIKETSKNEKQINNQQDIINDKFFNSCHQESQPSSTFRSRDHMSHQSMEIPQTNEKGLIMREKGQVMREKGQVMREKGQTMRETFQQRDKENIETYQKEEKNENYIKNEQNINNNENISLLEIVNCNQNRSMTYQNVNNNNNQKIQQLPEKTSLIQSNQSYQINFSSRI